MNKQQIELWLFPPTETVKIEFEPINDKRVILVAISMTVLYIIGRILQ